MAKPQNKAYKRLDLRIKGKYWNIDWKNVWENAIKRMPSYSLFDVGTRDRKAMDELAPLLDYKNWEAVQCNLLRGHPPRGAHRRARLLKLQSESGLFLAQVEFARRKSRGY